MITGNLIDAAAAMGGILHGADRSYRGVSSDSRTISADELFFAFRGARVDAAAFITEVAARSAACAVVEQRQDTPLQQIVVAETRLGFGELARAWRQRFSLPLIGITGSNGKTTSKEMIASIMRAHYPASGEVDAVLVTWGNLNNEIGLPRTLTYLGSQHRAAVIEMGAAKRGDIAYLARIAAPTVSLLTNAARAHLQGFGTIEDVATTKGEIFDVLPADGTAVVNRDDRFFTSWWQRASRSRRVSFGLHPDANVRATDIAMDRGGMAIRFTLHTQGSAVPLRLEMAGAHNVVNALGAAAAAMAAGAGISAVVDGLSSVRNFSGRLRKVEARGRFALFDDTYNANPGSVRAAISFLGGIRGERWLVLGDMAELGEDSDAMHREMGAAALRAGITRLYCAGPRSRAAASEFGARAQWRESVDEIADLVSSAIRADLTVLVKGSRSMGMERVVQALAADSGRGG
ncbi:MAG: UDP-N-acetylmuramoyl-tripeptide--D-alanyl-D-alanine ligase [Gammaproteobacteria bacterium]|nr:UDP-N-acetylmuramoyl-tripeptide--D-alanyl-D-alanine ligase [Gammaproteobacteria bacterium]